MTNGLKWMDVYSTMLARINWTELKASGSVSKQVLQQNKATEDRALTEHPFVRGRPQQSIRCSGKGFLAPCSIPGYIGRGVRLGSEILSGASKGGGVSENMEIW